MTRRPLLGATLVAVAVVGTTLAGTGAAAAGEIPTPATDSYAVDYRTALSVPVERGLLANDDPGPYRAPVVTDVDVTGLAGTVAVDAVGSFRFTPTADFHGETSFLYRIADGPGGQESVARGRVVLTVGDVAARPDSYHLAVDVSSLVVDDPSQGLLVNDLSAGLGVGGAALAVAPAHGTVDLADDGTFSYAPTPGFAGVDTFTYQVTGTTNTSTATVGITVDPPNADLSITLVSDVAKPVAGSTMTLRVTVHNAGPRRAGFVAVGLDVGPGLAVKAAPGGAVTGGGSGAVWSLTKFAVGRSLTYTVSVKVRPDSRGPQSAVAAVRSLDLVDLVPCNDRRTRTVRAVAP